MATEKRKHRMTIEERRRGQAAGAATRRAKREETEWPLKSESIA
jgi:hypothetical protein